MKSNNSRGGIFISVLCTFMVIILCFTVFSGAGRNYFNVVTGFYQYCGGLFSTLDALGLTPRVSVSYVDSFRYGDADKGFNYYLVFRYPKTPPLFIANPALLAKDPGAQYLAKFKATPIGSGEYIYSYEWVGTNVGGKISTRNLLGKQRSEADLCFPIQQLSKSEFDYIGLYSLYFDGITFLIRSDFGSVEFTFSKVTVGGGFAGGH